MEEIKKPDQKALDKHVEDVGNGSEVNLSASNLSNEDCCSDSKKVSNSMENSKNNSEIMIKSSLSLESENMSSSVETCASYVQPTTQTSDKFGKSISEIPLSDKSDVNVEGIPIDGGDVFENECAPEEELESRKDYVDNSVSDSVKEASIKYETSDTDKETSEFCEKLFESDVHMIDNAEPKISVTQIRNPDDFQKESSDGYCLENSIHNFPKSVLSGSETRENNESECETAATCVVINTDDVSASDVVDCERILVQNDLENVCKSEDSETNGNKKGIEEENANSENIVSVTDAISESKVESMNETLTCSVAETSKVTEIVENEGIKRESVIASDNNVPSETNDEFNKMVCNDKKETMEIESPVSKPGLEQIELDENSLTNDNENSLRDSSLSQVVSQTSDLTCMETNESEMQEKDPHSGSNQDNEEILSEDIDLEVEKTSEKESHSDVNNEEEEMLLSGETEINIQRSEKEFHFNLDKDDEDNFLNEENEISVIKSFKKISGEIDIQEAENVADDEKHIEINNDKIDNNYVRGGSIEKENRKEKGEGHEENDKHTTGLEVREEEGEGIFEDKNGKVTEEATIINNLEKDSGENSRDIQDNVEFVQIDSDKEENSQQSLDVTNETADISESDPIAVSNEEHKDDDIIVEEETEDQAVEVDDISEVEKDDGSIADRAADSAEEPESVDISEMCETVLEEATSTVFKNPDESGVSQKRKKTPLVASDVSGDDTAEIIDVEIIDDSEKEKSLTSKSNMVEDGKEKSKTNAVSHQFISANDLSNINDDEEICIIPDSVPRLITGKEAKGRTDALKARRISRSNEGVEKVTEKLSEIQKDITESRRTPGRPQRQAAKRAECQIKEIAAIDEAIQETEERSGGFRVCNGCFKVRSWVTSFKFQENGTEKVKYFCSQDCASNFKKTSRTKSTTDADGNLGAGEPVKRFTRKCAQCSLVINGDEKNLSWETMDYCNEECLGRYQKVLGSQCANCKGTVASASLGKYCVRFGYDVKQFCCSGCLEEFKKGLKNCSYCQKDISSGSEGFLAPVGDKGQFKDFCTQLCMEKYDQMSNNHAPPVVVQVCAVCNNEKVVSMEVIHKNRINKFCSEPCFAAFRFVNGMMADQCYMCKKYFDKKEVENFSVYSDDLVHSFCSKTCMNVYILGNRKIVACHWCKVKKYNFDMIKRVFNSGQLLLVCSLNCLSLYQTGVNAASSKRVICDMCGGLSPSQYNLNMSDNTVRNFCSYPCVMKFQENFSNKVIADSTPFPTGGPKRYIGPRRSLPMQHNEAQRENAPSSKTTGSTAMPVISSVQSLASDDSPAQNDTGVSTRSSAALKQVNSNIPQNASQSSKIVRQVIIRPPMPKPMRNKAVTCRPTSLTKGTHCRPVVSSKETQTEDSQRNPVLIPVPVPIYVPAPMCMYSTSFPVPVPFPLPIPVPIFIPTTRNSAKGIMKEIKRIQEKIPTDPFEAEILMMAEIVAGQKKEENCDSDSDNANNADEASETGADAEEGTKATTTADSNYTPENVDNSSTFGDDMLQMALLKMATELEEPTDLEAALTPTTITTQPAANTEHTNSESEDDPEPVQPPPEPRIQRGKKRPVRSQRTSTTSTSASTTSNKRRRVSASGETPHLPPPEPTQLPPVVEQEKPDANMCLKYTLGVNAWKRWVLTKNAELEKAAANNRKLKLFKTEILQQTADELNYSLCLFVKEVRKPNGQEYAPDTIYYLCLGIQQYLFESGRIDNIFTDPYYEKFTECLDEVAKKFSSLYNDSQYIVTRVEEEHLWESKQLGAHSPHVLLSTLMFFNTKHFNLTTVEEHMQLSFSHIMKHWKRNPNQSGGTKGSSSSSRNVLLRFYPPQLSLEGNSKKKKVYEQQENEENPLRCPVKLYEFYLSKCPESVKTRNDVFYLLPERSCVPDSPVWYSTMALGKEPLMKMLHRVKMVKEINQALLKS